LAFADDEALPIQQIGSGSSTDQGGGKRRGGMATGMTLYASGAFYLPIWEDSRAQFV
jgi:hypothetical protein